MDDNIIIRVKELTKSFKTQTVLKNINVEFERGTITGLIGRNGSGKTVLLKSMAGFIMPTSGEIEVEGEIVGKDIDIPSNMGIIIETPGFLPNYTGYKNLKMLAMINRKISKQDIKDTITRVGLNPDSKKHVGKYSLGMRQRLGIAQAIMENPDILLLDEPMNGLDNNGVEDVRKILIDLKNEGKTIILASHSMEDIDILCDKVYRMEAGVLSLDNRLKDI